MDLSNEDSEEIDNRLNDIKEEESCLIIFDDHILSFL
jgi:hypothetical protein